MSLEKQLYEAQQHIQQAMENALVALNIADASLAQAMHYGLMNGGKRLRPFLVYATCEALGGNRLHADAAAMAIEMIHSYSLVHDDLPAMDDDDLRRGKPSCHIAFNEATAILAGDALLTAAFEVLVTANDLALTQRLQLVKILARAAGGAGMVAGQCIDLSHVGQHLALDELQAMHQLKTGALIEASILMGAYSAQPEVKPSDIEALTAYAKAVGLAFQVWDDVLDVEGDTATLGKKSGQDSALNKPTYPVLMGLDAAKKKALDLVAEAKQHLNQVAGETAVLAQLADYIIAREY